MFDTRKFGGYLSRLRKNADMTQSELADKLNVTRQAISRYELGDSFPDVSILVIIADIFGITLDELISAGEPTRGESLILGSIARGQSNISAESIDDVLNLAPFLKPSMLDKLSARFSRSGIDISNILTLAEYLSDDGVRQMVDGAEYGQIDNELLEKFLPLLDYDSKLSIFAKLLDGEMDWHFLKMFFPYAGYLSSQIEAAVIEGALPWEALKLLRESIIEQERALKRTL